MQRQIDIVVTQGHVQHEVQTEVHTPPREHVIAKYVIDLISHRKNGGCPPLLLAIMVLKIVFRLCVLIRYIRKTCPCNVYPVEPHFYIAKLGVAGVYLFFLFLLQNIDCGYSLEPPRRGGSNVYPQSMF